MDEDTLHQRIDRRLQGDSIEAAQMQRAVRARMLDEPVEPTLIGRYAVVRRLGAGGMGVVYVARDAELHREVAVKLVRSSARASEREQRRLLEEARALARIAHPNVVAIYDVGMHADRVFIAMELVHGETLRVHCAERCASWRERVAAYLQAGRGLAAAHAAGLVHRDFKPDNALVGRDGRVQIADFGLAHEGRGAIDEPTAPPSPATDGHSTAAIAGTVRYMAPEQLRGQPADARADQFSFCVALWEAIHLEHPFAMIEAVARQSPGAAALREVGEETYRMRELANGDAATPLWLRRVLQRGLAFDLHQRFATMDELLAALSDDPLRRRRRRIAIAIGVLAIPSILGAQLWSKARERDACAREGETIDVVWNDSARASVQAAILAPQLSYGTTTWERIEPRLDAYAAEWTAMRTSTCLAALEGRRQPDLAARSSECLLERRDELAAMVDELTKADADTIRNAVDSVSELASLASCDDVASLAKRSAPPDDAALRDEVASLRRELMRSRALWSAGQAAAARVVADDVLARAEAIEWPAVQLDALMQVGFCLDRDDPAGAVARYQQAFALAVLLGDDEVAIDALARLTHDHASELGRPQEAALWSQVAEAFVARADPEGGLLTAQWLTARGDLSQRNGDSAAALADFQRGHAIREQALGPDDGRTLQVLGRIATAQFALGDSSAAEASLDAVVAGRVRLLGPDHPDVGRAMAELGRTYGAEGRFREAREQFERALAIEERALGPDHPQLATTLSRLGLVHERQGDAAAAQAFYERSRVILERRPQADPLALARVMMLIAGAHSNRGELRDAVGAAERALAITEAAVGTHHPQYALALDDLGFAHQQSGQYELARSERRRVLELREAALGPWHADTGSACQDLAYTELYMGNAAASLELARRGLAIDLVADGPNHPNTYFALDRMGLAYRMLGDNEAGLAAMRDANAIAEFVFAQDDPLLTNSVRNVGEMLRASGDPAAALPQLQRAREMYERLPEAARTDGELYELALAEAELDLGHVERALVHARAGVERAERYARPQTWRLAEAEMVLADALQAAGKRTEARALREKACAVEHPAICFRLATCDAASAGARGAEPRRRG